VSTARILFNNLKYFLRVYSTLGSVNIHIVVVSHSLSILSTDLQNKKRINKGIPSWSSAIDPYTPKSISPLTDQFVFIQLGLRSYHCHDPLTLLHSIN